jgi:ketosteroid isomerase-like protein
MTPDQAKEIKDAAHGWMEALRRRDEPALDGLLHDDFALISSRGWAASVVTRADWLRNSITHWILHEFRFEHIDVHVYDGTAVMRSRFVQRATVRGEPLNFTAYLTDVWVRDKESWRVVTRHASPTDLDEATLARMTAPGRSD